MKKIYRCDFCRCSFENEEYAKEHEENCMRNPKIKTCGRCRHSENLYNETSGCSKKDDRHVFGEIRINCPDWE